MSETVDGLTVAYTDDADAEQVRELDRLILSTGVWATILYRYQERDRTTGEWSGGKARLVRYQKRNGRYSARSSFNISNHAQALQICAALSEWFPAEGEA